MKYAGKVLRRFVGLVLKFPVSPSAFGALILALRTVRVLRKPVPRNSGRIERIFVAHPYSSVGDLVLLMPLLERLETVWSEAEIHVAIPIQVADLLGAFTKLRCLPFPDLNLFQHGMRRNFPQLRGLMFRYRVIRNLLAFYRQEMMRYDYDLAIAPRWGSITTWPAVYLAYLTGARRIVGYSGTVDGGSAEIDCLLTCTTSGGSHEHESERNLALLNRVGVLEEPFDAAAVLHEPIHSLLTLARHKPDAEIFGLMPNTEAYAVISPGATAAFRTWPAEQLIRVMRDLHSRTGLTFCIVGSAGDAVPCGQIVEALPHCAVSLVGRTSLRQLVRLLARAQLFIGMDSGTAHIAGALGIPTVVLCPFPSSCTAEHPNSPVRFRPCGPRVRVLQPRHPLPPCNPTCSFPVPHCIQQISPASVLAAVAELFDTGSGVTALAEKPLENRATRLS